MDNLDKAIKIGDIVGSSDPYSEDVYLITHILDMNDRKYIYGFDQYGRVVSLYIGQISKVLDHVDIERTFQVMRECKSKN